MKIVEVLYYIAGKWVSRVKFKKDYSQIEMMRIKRQMELREFEKMYPEEFEKWLKKEEKSLTK